MPLMTVRSQVANWSSRGLVNSLTAKFSKSCNYYTVFNTLNLTLTPLNIESVLTAYLPEVS